MKYKYAWEGTEYILWWLVLQNIRALSVFVVVLLPLTTIVHRFKILLLNCKIWGSKKQKKCRPVVDKSGYLNAKNKISLWMNATINEMLEKSCGWIVALQCLLNLDEVKVSKIWHNFFSNLSCNWHEYQNKNYLPVNSQMDRVACYI